jgi:tripartite ATP-independent transporter DctP family solute receptor
MKQMRGIVILVLILLLPLMTGSAVASPTKIRLGHLAITGQTTDLAAKKFAEILSEKSGGKISVAIYPSTQLGGERELMDGMQMGSVEMAIFGLNFAFVRLSKEFGLIPAYFLFKSQDHYRKFMEGTMGKSIRDMILQKREVRVLALANRGPRHITSKAPIRTPEDLRGIKIRIPEQSIYIDCMKALGANPTAVPFTELFTALQQGIVEAQENPLELIYSSTFYEVQKYISLTAHQNSAYLYYVSEKFFKTLPSDLQPIVVNAAVEAARFQDDLQTKEETTLLTLLKEKGMVVIQPDRASFESRMKGVYQKWAGSSLPGLYEAILEAAK